MSLFFDNLRRKNRLTLNNENLSTEENQTPLVLTSIELLQILDQEYTDKELYNTITILYQNITQMQEAEINSFSKQFPYQEIFNLIIDYENLEIQEALFWCFCIMTRGTNFQVDDFISSFNLYLLLIFLDHPTFSICSTYFLSFLCAEHNNLCQVLCEYGLLDKFSNPPYNEYQSQFIELLCLHVKTAEFQIQLCSIVLSMFDTESIEIIDDALKSYMSLFIRTRNNESSAEKVQLISDYLVENFEKFMNLNNFSVICEYLDMIACIENLPEDLIPMIFDLFNNGSVKIARSCSNILSFQCKNWFEKVDVELLYKIVFSIFNSDVSIDDERVFLTVLLNYGNVQYFILPEMISRIVKFLSFDKCSLQCLNALLLILTTSGKEPKELLGNLLDEVFSIVNDLYQTATDESFEIISQILDLLDQSNE